MTDSSPLRLGVNIDHVATLRNARGGTHPDPATAAQLAAKAGADGITAHLREDRRHVREHDIDAIKEKVALPLNLEMAATGEMLTFALNTKPNAVCIVPENRQEITTEGGLDVINSTARLKPLVARLKEAGIRVSLFVEPERAQLDAAVAVGADITELHTGRYSHLTGAEERAEIKRLAQAASHAAAIGLECHAGHGLRFDNVGPVAAITEVIELNIGHFLIGESVFLGLGEAVRRMRRLMDEARAS